VPECPYVGLVPFDEKDAKYFFGREDESDLIIANLTASRLTLLYAPSGVGKSSVLRAGVLPQLHDSDDDSYDDLGVSGAAVAYVYTWRDNPLETIAAAVGDAVSYLTGARPVEAGVPKLSVAWLREVLRQSKVSAIYLILDQFEEYFLYHSMDRGEEGLTAELGRILSARDLPVHVLLSIREDALAQLDRFEGRVPHLFDNYLRLAHLSRDAARTAIEGPRDRYNRIVAPGQTMSIEPDLIGTLLDQVRTGHVQVAPDGTAPDKFATDAPASDDRGDIEAPYLQLVLTRLWKQERATGSSSLRQRTLYELGGAQTIVQTHLDNVMAELSPAQIDVAAAVFHHLVTPSGTKIALTAKDLADWSGQPVSAVQDLLETLCAGPQRILRPVPPAVGVAGPPRYEIFHDVIGAAVLDWRRRHEAQRQQDEASRHLIAEREEARAAAQTVRRRLRRTRFIAAGMALVLLVIAGLGTVAWVWYRDAQKQQALSAAAATLGRDPAKSLEWAFEAYRRDPSDVAARTAVLTAVSSPQSQVVAGPDPTVVGDRQPRVVGMEVAPDGQHVIAYDAQGGVFVITGKDAVERRPTAPLAGVVTGAVSADGARVALVADGGGVTIVDIRAAKEPVNLATSQVTSFSKVSWLDSDNLVLVVTPSEDAATYSASTGELVARFPVAAYDAIPTADGLHVMTSDPEYRLRVWNAQTGEMTNESPVLEDVPLFLRRYKQSIVGLALSTTERAIVVWDWQQTLIPEVHPVQDLPPAPAEVSLVEVDQENDWVYIAIDKQLFGFGLPNPGRVGALPVQADWVYDSASIRDGRWIVTAGGDGRVLVWSAYHSNRPTYELLGHEGPVLAVHSLRDGQDLVSLGFDGTVRWWDMDLAGVQRFDEHTGWVLNADVDVSGSWLATAGRDGVYIADLDDLTREATELLPGNMLDARFDPADPHHFFTLRQYAEAPQAWHWDNDGSVRAGTQFVTPQLGSNDYLISLDISRDGKTAAGGDTRGNIHLWNTATGTLLPHQPLQVPDGSARDVAFDPSGQFLAAVGPQGVYLWQLGTDKPPTLRSLSNATTVTFNPSGGQLVSGAKGKLRIWSRDGQDLRDHHDLDVHGSSLGEPSFSADGRLLAVGTAEGLIQVWEVGSRGTVWLTRQHGDFVNDVLFLSGDQPRLLSASDDSTVALSLPCEACQDPDGFANRVASSPR
jgi:WD40 repeat protein